MLKATSPKSVSDIINAIQAYSETITSSKWLVQPIVKLFSDSVILENADEVGRFFHFDLIPIVTNTNVT
jgi:nuclear cap-binding protein subunit 1